MRQIQITLTLCITLAMGAVSGFAQSQIERVESVDRNIAPAQAKEDSAEQELLAPTIYDGELEDIGPQYLLLEQARRKWLEMFADLQVYRTSNANLFEENAESTDILATTFQAALIPYSGKQLGGKLKARIGYRQQYFYYGTFSGDTEDLNGTPAEALDFTNRQPFADVTLTRGPLRLKLGVHYSELRNRQSNDRFYKEIVPAWSASYDIELSPKAILTPSYSGTYRSTDSESFGFLPEDWNDQTEHSLSLTYGRLLTDKLILQSATGVEYSYYLNDERDREDLLVFMNVTLAYYFSSNLSARLFTSYETRESSEALTEDYTNWNLGGGASVNYAF